MRDFRHQDLLRVTPDLAKATRRDVAQAINYSATHKLDFYYPDAGPLRRQLYVKHMAYFAAGADHSERAFIAGNRVGKTEGVGAYEVTLHLTGEYPHWWKGKRFNGPVKVWAAGDTNQTTRDILQAKLLGVLTRSSASTGSEVIGLGTGTIPAISIVNTKPKAGIPDAIETVYVSHKSGGVSVLTFKSYEQGRKSFQGTEIDIIWLDEEPPEDVYDECAIRTMATGMFAGGIILITFTPLEGWTKVIERFLNETEREKSGRYVIQASWDDAPHLSAEEKADRLRKLPAYQREARSLGKPQLGSGAIYPVPESEITVDPFAIPHHWPRVYALDVGWNRTAAVWGAFDRDSQVWYLYAEHYYAHADCPQNARAILGKGSWIPGVIDPAARGRGQGDGEQLLVNYRNQGLDLTVANNTVEAGIQLVWELMLEGHIKIFKTLPNWFSEFRLYRRDIKGRIVKDNDHLMDATRYLAISGKSRMRCQPPPKASIPEPYTPSGGRGWMS